MIHSTKNQLEYASLKPDGVLKDLVESIWMMKYHEEETDGSMILPDGKIDVAFLAMEDGSFEIFISGIFTGPVIKPPFPKSTMGVISFHPIAAEYIFQRSFADLKNNRQKLSGDYWGFCTEDLSDFKHFYEKACNRIELQLTKEVDPRKRKLFELIYSSKGATTVKELSEQAGWSSRQINRYFNHWLGVSLKSYLNMIRFSNSLKQLKKGDFYPELNYGDQSHFIREVKKFTGVRPTILNKNENDRFIQLSMMPKG
ncbi:AraC-like DNA-binding protein [Chryseobacterium sp. SORGH_AS 447]|uniref:helix-turn-helix domain-containing protein n=1 Tax=Chryseobacterium sp. SORGH_AS_0447 TaxID=3041769 RepID=UPI0027837895|nr:AraC family transcriptional regulator [Chryseobacterium sp. SORGH_AS_0447]MDQ1162511.1 AraC-like DNA-binding protein [Chryseobacterium sp. SORGH_AS_0447]